MGELNAEIEVTYSDRYGDVRTAFVTDSEYAPDDIWEGTDYAARDTKSGLPVVLEWDERDGWSEVDR